VDLVLAGNIELIIFTLGSMVAWTASYVFRVANKVRVVVSCVVEITLSERNANGAELGSVEPCDLTRVALAWQDMTYVKQLKDYEDAVMAKRYVPHRGGMH
jgi:hypothetical protein